MNDDDFSFDDDLEFDDLDDSENPFDGVEAAKPSLRTLDEFEAEVDQNIKLLMSAKNDAEKRKEAALWLGESGSLRAIPPLVKIYAKDKKNKAVQDAATYALGQFKALDQAIIREDDELVLPALVREENEHILTALEEIALNDKRGKRGGGGGKWLIASLVLLLTLGGLIAANLLIDVDAPAPTITSTPTEVVRVGNPAQIASQDLTHAAEQLTADLAALRAQYTPDGEPEVAVNCALEFNSPETVTIGEVGDAAEPLNAFAAQYSTLYGEFLNAKTLYDAFCATAATPEAEAPDAATETAVTGISVTQSTLTQLDEITAKVQTLTDEITAHRVTLDEQAAEQAALDAQATLEAQQTLDAEQAVPDVSEPIFEPTEEVIEGLTSIQLRTHAGQLYDLTDQALRQRGFVDVLNQYWTEVRDTGQTGGCNLSASVVPEDYVLPEADAALAPELAGAVTQVNVGLQLARTGWTFFTNACTAGTLAQNIDLGLSTTNTATSAFEEANRILDGLTGW